VAPLAAGAATLALVGVAAGTGWIWGSPVAPADASWAWTLLALLAAAFATYCAGLALRVRRTPRVRPVLALAIAIQTVPLAAPLLLSTDAWTYWVYGTIGRVYGNPYRDRPAEFPEAPGYPWMGSDWVDTTSVYGPLFTLASEAVDAVAGSSEDVAAWAFKLLAAAALVAAAVLAARLSPRPALAAAFVGWNPVLAIHGAGGGHNDMWIGALVVGALALGAAGHRQWAGVAWAGGIFVKWIPLLLLPLRALEARRSGRRVGHLGFAVAVVLFAGVATAIYGLGWVDAARPLAENAERRTRFAVPARLEQLGVPEDAALALALAGFAVAYAWLLREAWRGRARLGLAAALFLLAVPYLAPWYLAWTVPVAAAEDDAPAQWLGLALTAYLLPQTIPI
jgi:alpha-1,6-mannosyltransferase